MMMMILSTKLVTIYLAAEYIRQLVSNKNSLRERVRELQTALGDV